MDTNAPHCAEEKILYLSLELGKKKWVLTFSAGDQRRRRKEMEAGQVGVLRGEIEQAKKHFKLAESVGVRNVVVDSSSIEVPRRRRRAKTDRLDGEALLRLLVRHVGGEERVWSVVRAPSVEEEDGRRLHREQERLTKERTQHRARIESLLGTQGVRVAPGAGFEERLEGVRLWDGSKLGPDLKGEVLREHERLKLVEQQQKALRREQVERLKAVEQRVKARGAQGLEGWEVEVEQVMRLMQLRGVQWGAWVLVMEFFGWRKFRNRREVGSLAGLTGTPSRSGEGDREQGISKAGNRRVRALMIELAWCWLRYQGQSKLAQWYEEKYGGGSKRLRRVGIVAVGRRLLVDFWKYVERGVVPEGAELKKAG